ncbi:MAG: nonstructural protein [Microviridae sp.]|nr:MAG: nonstructural protein [Microviridae sp.]
MIIRAYSIFDVKGSVFHTPWFQHTDALAMRTLHDLVNDPSTTIGRHPADFRLYFIGTYDDQLGLMMPVTPLAHVCEAVSLTVNAPTLASNEEN